MITIAPAKGWTEKRLDEIAEIEREIVSPEAIQGGTKYVGLEHIDGSGEFVNVRTVANGDLASAKFRFTRQHVLFGKLRPYLRKIARPNFEGVCSTDILPILPRPSTDRGFLFHYLRHPRVIEEATLRCEGANLPRLSPRQLESFPVLVPPKPAEQKRIAAILDKADAIRRRCHDALQLIDESIAAAFSHIVGMQSPDYRTWARRTIEALASEKPGAMRTGPFGSDLRHSEFVDSGIAVLGIDNAVQNRFVWAERRFVTTEKYAGLRRYTVKPEDVIITIMGTTGRSAVIPKDIPTAITTKHLASITLNRQIAEPEFVSNAVHRHPEILGQIERANRGAIMSGLNLGLIKRLELPVPPIAIQTTFARFVKDIREREDRRTDAAKMANDLFDSLVQRAFRGEL